MSEVHPQFDNVRLIASEEHSWLGASSLERSTRCTASPLVVQRVLEKYPERGGGTEATFKGSAEHDFLLIDCIRNEIDPESLRGNVYRFAEGDKEDQGHALIISDEHIEHAYMLKAWIDSTKKELDDPDLEVVTEFPVDFENIFGLPDSFSWIDLLCYSPKHKLVIVVDFKTTRYKTLYPEGFRQIIAYILGAASGLNLNLGEFTAKAVIYQPNVSSPRHPFPECDYDLQELRAWNDFFSDIGIEIGLDPKLEASTEACEWCPAKPECKAHHELQSAFFNELTPSAPTTDIVPVETPPVLTEEKFIRHLTDAQIARVLDIAPLVRGFLSAVENHALIQAQNNTVYEGWKVVPAQTKSRYRGSSDEILTILNKQWHLKLGDISRKTLKPLSEIRKVLKDHKNQSLLKRFNNDFVEKPTGKPVLVPESDPRTPIKTHFESIETHPPAKQEVLEARINSEIP